MSYCSKLRKILRGVIMRKLFMLIASMMVMAMVVAGCGGGDKKAAPEKKAAGQKIVIGLDDNFAPMGFRDKDNKIVGLDIDLAREACKRAGLTPEFKPIDWNAKEAEIKSKRIDAIWNCFTVNPDRQKTYGLSKPYLNNSQMIVVPKGSAIKSKADLKGKTVGVQVGSTGEYLFTKKDPAFGKELKKMVTHKDFPTLYIDMDNKRLDAIIADAVLAYDYAKKKPGKYEVLKDSMSDEVVAVAFRKDDKELIAKIDKALDEMKKDGTAKKICEQWLGADMIKYDKK